MKTTAYISAITTGGGYKNFKVDMDNKESVKKLDLLKQGYVTTFDCLDNQGFQTAPGDIIKKSTFTIYPSHLAILEIRIVETPDPTFVHPPKETETK